MLSEYGDDRQVSDQEYDRMRSEQQSDIVDTLIGPRDNAADYDSDSEYDEVIVFEQVSKTIDDTIQVQPTRNGDDEDSDWDGEICFETDKDKSTREHITAVPDRLGSGDVLDNNSNKEGQTETGNTTAPTIPQANDA